MLELVLPRAVVVQAAAQAEGVEGEIAAEVEEALQEEGAGVHLMEAAYVGLGGNLLAKNLCGFLPKTSSIEKRGGEHEI